MTSKRHRSIGLPSGVVLGSVLLFAAMPSEAQPYGNPQFGANPLAGQPSSPFGSGSPGGPSLVGAWSGTKNVGNLAAQITDAYDAQGHYVSVVRLSNGVLLRVWGTYQAEAAGPDRVFVRFNQQGWLPRELCQQAPGNQPSCQPFNLPAADPVQVTFTSPNTLQSYDPAQPSLGVFNASRDANPYLLQQQVPAQQVVFVQGPPPAAPAPVQPAAPAPGYSYQSPSRPAGPRCDDLQQRRICAINDGHLVVSGGCLTCVAP